MQDDNPKKPREGKGRPTAPFKFERLAIATHHAKHGMTFKAAAEPSLLFGKFDTETDGYVRDDEVNGRLPGTDSGRRTALYAIRRELLAPWLSSSCPPCFNGRLLPIPLALRFDVLPKRGRPKKMRSR